MLEYNTEYMNTIQNIEYNTEYKNTINNAIQHIRIQYRILEYHTEY